MSVRPVLPLFVACALAIQPFSPICGDEPAAIPEVAKQAKQILENRCHVCHGQDGTDEGGFNSVLSRDRMIATKRLVPGNPGESVLLLQVLANRMPKDDEPLSDAEKQVLQDWIAAGAPDFDPPAAPREFLSPDYIFAHIKADLDKHPKANRKFNRYFLLTHLYNAGVSDDELQTYRHGVSKLVNSLSYSAEIVRPTAIDPAETILRADLRNYAEDGDEGVMAAWDLLLEFHPYSVKYETTDALYCYAQTGTDVPALPADWFVHAAARPPLYHALLGMPENIAEIEQDWLELDIAANIKNGVAARAGFNGSGVSRNNRLIERHPSVYGAYWKSYDFGKNSGSANLFSHPLGPGIGKNDFQHDGGEVIFNLPNGLQAYYLCDSSGNRIDEGPTAIVADPRSPNQAVINGISCMSCHAQGMIDKNDQIRDHVLMFPNAYSQADTAAVKALYRTQAEFKALLNEDRERFRKAVEATGAPFSTSEPIFTLARRFEAELDLKAAAAEAGLTPQQFLAAVRRSPALSRVLGPLASGLTVQREVYADLFADIISQVRGRTPLIAIASDAFDLPTVWEGNVTESSQQAIATPIYKMKLTVDARDGDAFSGTIVYPNFDNATTKFNGTIAGDRLTFTETEQTSGETPIGLGGIYQARIRGDRMRGEWSLDLEEYQAKGTIDLTIKASGPQAPTTEEPASADEESTTAADR
jgi:mono/diheme cytochrome c family protein